MGVLLENYKYGEEHAGDGQGRRKKVRKRMQRKRMRKRKKEVDGKNHPNK